LVISSARANNGLEGRVAQPKVDGIEQKPIEDVSLAYTFDEANARRANAAPRPVFRDDGGAGAVQRRLDAECGSRPPWELLGKAIQDPASAYKFELYDVRHDWTRCIDVAETTGPILSPRRVGGSDLTSVSTASARSC
jgi:arylsulfatase